MRMDTFVALISDMTKQSAEALLTAGGCILCSPDSPSISVEWSAETNTVFFHAKIVDVPTHNKEAFYEFLLQAQLISAATQEGCFGIRPDTQALLLFQRLNTTHLYDLDCFAALSKFREQAIYWTKLLNSTYLSNPSILTKSIRH